MGNVIDSFQLAAPDQPQDTEAVGYLAVNNKEAIIRAYCFRKRTRHDQGNQWTLDRVWICPKYRRMGYLERQWKSLETLR